MDMINKLVVIADEGFNKAARALWEAYEEYSEYGLSDHAQLESIAGRLIAAANVHDFLTGPIPDDLASRVLKFDEPFSMLQEKLYMSRDIFNPSFYARLVAEVRELLDPLNEIAAAPEHENDPTI